MKRLLVLLTVILSLAPGFASGQSLTGTVAGTVVDEQGGVLPGVTVTLTGKKGSVTAVTDEKGEYRFVALEPGNYEVKAELSGFTPQTQRNLDVGITKTVEADFSLKIGGLTESVEVVATASTIDASSAATDNSLSQELLSNMPINFGNAATNLLNYAPGINDGTGYGGQGDYGNALMIDGVDTRDPDGGSAWVFYNYNLVEEVQVGGLGAPAEYGGFSGAVINTITKSGGNLFSGLADYRYTNDSLASSNVGDDDAELNPALANADVTTSLNDFTVQFGGPMRKDKAFFFMSVQRYSVASDPSGPRTVRSEISPRFNGKVTFQLSPTDTIIGSFQYDNYNQKGRTGYPGSASTDSQTVEQDSPEWVYNAQYRKVFGQSTFLEAKYSGWWGYFYLDPIDQTPVRYDGVTGEYSGGGGYYGYYDRTRNQLNVSLSRYAQAYGQHTFKFGVEIERSKSRNRYGYSGGFYFYDYGGEPYTAYAYSYDWEGFPRRESYYAQDSWKIGRLTANLGLRLDNIRGYSKKADETVFTPDLAWGPRLGVAFDATGKGTSVFKTFWGRYYEGAQFNPFYRAVPEATDYIGYYVDPVTGQVTDEEASFSPTGTVYGIDPDIKNVHVDDFNASWEQQLRRDVRFAVTGIYRNTADFINSVIVGSQWSPVTLPNALTGGTYTGYRWANRTATQYNYYITNQSGFQYVTPDGQLIGTADPYRDYKALMAVLTKTMSNRWHGQLSYVWSETKGTVRNSGSTDQFGTGSGYVTGREWETPNRAIINSDGNAELNRTHEFKALLGYEIPKIDVSVNAYWRILSGTPYTPYQNYRSSVLNYPFSSARNIFLEPRGNQRTDTLSTLDVKFDKFFKAGIHRFGIYCAIQNLLNDGTITAVQTRVPDTVIDNNTVVYGSPTALTEGRQVIIGGNWRF